MTKKKSKPVEPKPIERILTEEDDLELVDPKLVEHNKVMRAGGKIILLRNGKQIVVSSKEHQKYLDAEGVYEFYLLSETGKMYAGGGTIILDVDGLTIYGEGKLILKKSDGTLIATIDSTTEGGRDAIKLLTTGSSKDIILESGGYSYKLRGDTGQLLPSEDITHSLGAPAQSFRYFVPTTTSVSRPAAGADYHGLLWVTSSEGYADVVWICLKNSDDDYEWVQWGMGSVIEE